MFPLELVLFPGAPLPLHIFEPRYREMIGNCLVEGSEFGVTCVFPGNGLSTARVGCTARIQSVLNEYGDGRLDILTVGMRRFRIKHVVEEKSYREADVEWLRDKRDEKSSAAERKRVIDLHNQLALLACEEGSDVDADMRAPKDNEHMEFLLAHALPFDLGVKQAVLEGNSEKHRLEVLVAAYEALLRRALEVVHQMESPPKHVM